jgi:RTA1 like protein
MLILVRSLFRIAELAHGFGSKLANNQVAFMILESGTMAFATVHLTLLHPAGYLNQVKESRLAGKQLDEWILLQTAENFTPLQQCREFTPREQNREFSTLQPNRESSRLLQQDGGFSPLQQDWEVTPREQNREFSTLQPNRESSLLEQDGVFSPLQQDWEITLLEQIYLRPESSLSSPWPEWV